MALSTRHKLKPSFTLDAYGFHLRLWNESGGVDWGASLHDGKEEVSCRFQEDNLTLAKLHLLAEARNRAMTRWPEKKFPSDESLIDSWEPVNMTESL
jgi:hypothetical protein